MIVGDPPPPPPPPLPPPPGPPPAEPPPQELNTKQDTRIRQRTAARGRNAGGEVRGEERKYKTKSASNAAEATGLRRLEYRHFHGGAECGARGISALEVKDTANVVLTEPLAGKVTGQGF